MANFSSRDLALFVPDDNTRDAYTLRHTETGEKTEVYQPLKPKVDPTKRISRYRAGHVPKWAEEKDDEEKNLQIKKRTPHKPTVVGFSSASKHKPKILSIGKEKKEDEVEEEEEEEEEKSKVAQQEFTESSDSSEEDDDAIDERRRLLRERHLKRQQEELLEEKEVAIEKESSDEDRVEVREEKQDEEEESEWETDTDDSEDDGHSKMLKPVFVPKAARETKLELERLELEQEKRIEEKLQKVKSRKEETRELVAIELRKEAEAQEMTANQTDSEMPDDTDDIDPEAEYQAWELRELRRIKRDQDKRDEIQRELDETNRRRNLTAEERRLEDERRKDSVKEKKKWKFMQKYYHKGVFFMDESSVKSQEDVRMRDASGATLEDKFDKSMVPKVMQVKNFGRSGRTKYTHLVDQDTTQQSALWSKKDSIREKYASKLSGTGDIDMAGRKRKHSDRGSG